MPRRIGAAVLGTGLVIGVVCSMLIPSIVVEAQASWQCKPVGLGAYARGCL